MKNNPIHVGQNLNGLRKSRGLSLDKLAELTGVSKAMLAQVERGDSSPTISLLWKIANGLHVSLTSLLAEQLPAVTVVQVDELEPLLASDGLYRSYPLFPFDPQNHFEIYTVEMDPGCLHESEPHHEGVEEYVIVTAGTLRLQINNELHEVEQGNAIRFTADQKHIYENAAATLTRLQVVIRYPF